MTSNIHIDRTAYRKHPAWKDSVNGTVERRIGSNGRTYACAHAEVTDRGLARLLLRARIRDLCSDISTVRVSLDSFEHEFIRTALVSSDWISMYVRVSAVTWTYPWSIGQLGIMLDHLVSSRKLRGVSTRTRHPLFLGAYEVRFRRKWNLRRTLEQHVRPAFEVAKSVVDEATAHLEAGARRGALVRVFRFPPEISSACEQYLLYFGQFLRDLGVEADTEIQHRAGEVLLRVIPASSAEALERIAATLQVYLGLTAMPQAVSVPTSGIAIARLHANILHLQSQLQLARSEMQAKDAAIQMLSIGGFQSRYGGGPAEDKEPLLGRAVSLTRYKGKWFEIDLPHIVRQLRGWFSPRRRRKP